VRDYGDELAPHKDQVAFPTPVGTPYQMDTWAGVHNLDTDYNHLVDVSGKLVLEQFEKVKTWMREETEFGLAWLAFYSGNAEIADAHDRWRLLPRYAPGWKAGDDPVLTNAMLSIGGPNLTPNAEGPLWSGKVVEAAIVNRLQELNVVFAETEKGQVDQANRMN